MGPELSCQALAFAENVPLRVLAAVFPQGTRTPHEIRVTLPEGGTLFLYPFGAAVFQDVDLAARAVHLATLRRAEPPLDQPGSSEDLVVREDPAPPAGVAGGVLIVDRLTPARSGII